MKRKVIPVLIGLLLIVLILAGAAGVFLFQRYSGSKEEADLNAYFGLNGSQAVSYTHLDVYKRQSLNRSKLCRA